jgi:hypothetical protein
MATLLGHYTGSSVTNDGSSARLLMFLLSNYLHRMYFCQKREMPLIVDRYLHNGFLFLEVFGDIFTQE